MIQHMANSGKKVSGRGASGRLYWGILALFNFLAAGGATLAYCSRHHQKLISMGDGMVMCIPEPCRCIGPGPVACLTFFVWALIAGASVGFLMKKCCRKSMGLYVLLTIVMIALMFVLGVVLGNIERPSCDRLVQPLAYLGAASAFVSAILTRIFGSRSSRQSLR